jgi:hypothetical protein
MADMSGTGSPERQSAATGRGQWDMTPSQPIEWPRCVKCGNVQHVGPCRKDKP